MNFGFLNMRKLMSELFQEEFWFSVHMFTCKDENIKFFSPLVHDLSYITKLQGEGFICKEILDIRICSDFSYTCAVKIFYLFKTIIHSP